MTDRPLHPVPDEETAAEAIERARALTDEAWSLFLSALPEDRPKLLQAAMTLRDDHLSKFALLTKATATMDKVERLLDGEGE